MENNCEQIRARFAAIQQDRLRFEAGKITIELREDFFRRLAELENELDPDTVSLRDRIAKRYGAVFVSHFKNEVAGMQLDKDRWVLLDKNGGRVAEDVEFTVNPIYGSGDTVMVGKIRVEGRSVYYLMDYDGVRQSKDCGYIGAFSDGVAIFKEQGAAAYGVLDEQGRAKNNRFEYLGEFQEGVALMSEDYGGSYFINKEAEIVARVDEGVSVGPVSNGRARCFKGIKSYYIRVGDKPDRGNGRRIGSEDFDDSTDFADERAIVRKRQNSRLIDTQGNTIAEFGAGFLKHSPFREGLAFVKGIGGGYFIDRQGRRLFGDDGWFKDSYGFADGLAYCVDRQGRSHYINKQGEVVFSSEAEGIAGWFIHGVLKIGAGDDVKYLNKKGKRIF